MPASSISVLTITAALRSPQLAQRLACTGEACDTHPELRGSIAYEPAPLDATAEDTPGYPAGMTRNAYSTVAQVLTNAATDTLMRKEYFPW